MFPELTSPVELALGNGKLNPAAVGYSRTPLHTSNLRGWGRNKRWEYWGITTPTHVLGLTISSLDYISVNQLFVYNRASGESFEEVLMKPLARGVVLPDHPSPLSASVSGKNFQLEFNDDTTGTAITVKTARLSAKLFSSQAGDSLGVVVPWSHKLFQYTVKDLARPITGELIVDGISYDVSVEDSFSVLDRGRGRWPYHKVWNWAAGSGTVNGHRLGVQFGGKWTAGTPATENALFVDGVMHYIPEELVWDYDLSDPMKPWRVSNDRVEAVMTPFFVRNAVTNALVISSNTTQAFGTWSGWVSDGAQQRYTIDGLTGWAEQAENRW